MASDTAATISNLTAADLVLFENIKIPIELLEAARIQRVTDAEARAVGIVRDRSARLEGLLFPYMPFGKIVGYQLRRDHPEMDAAGKQKGKYLSSFGDRRHFYMLPSDRAYLADISIPVVFVEAEKSKLAITAISQAKKPADILDCLRWLLGLARQNRNRYDRGR